MWLYLVLTWGAVSPKIEPIFRMATALFRHIRGLKGLPKTLYLLLGMLLIKNL